MAVNVVSFSFSTAQPEAQGPSSLLDDGFLYFILSATSLDHNSSGAPRASSAWCSLLYHIASITPTVWPLVLTELYNSSSPTQSPTQSLEWHIWSSSSGNKCHAVQRSLSSGASVYECIMGFFPCPILLARSTYAILSHKCHQKVSLPSGASLWPGRMSKYNTITRSGLLTRIRLTARI